MKTRLLIISPDYPPVSGGVADHTQLLASELARQGVPVAVLTSEAAPKARSVYPLVRNWHDAPALLEAIKETGPVSTVLWQYVPHMYGRGGVNRGIIRVMGALRRANAHQVVLAHEIAAPFSWQPHRAWYAIRHRQQWREILKCANRIAFSTEAWMQNWSEEAPEARKKFFLLPSPSAIPAHPSGRDHRAEWKSKRGIPAGSLIVSFFGTLSPAKQFDWVAEAWREFKGAPAAFVVIGNREQDQLAPVHDEMFYPQGHLPAEEVSKALQAVDLMVLPFVDGVSERRTTFMAALAHGLATMTTSGASTGSTLRSADFFRAAAADDRVAFIRETHRLLANPARRKELGERGAKAYEEKYGWPVVVETLREQLS